MGLISKTVIVKWNRATKNYYILKGYPFTKYGDEFEVKVEDLIDNSTTLVDVECDCKDCSTPIKKPLKWQNYKKCVHEDGSYYCNTCANKLYAHKNGLKTRLENSESFGYWLIKNLSLKQAVEIINRWDYELNNCDIREVSYSSVGLNKKGYWFKCPRNLHESELKNTRNFANNYKKRGYSDVLDCKVCNSIGQYLIDTYGENALDKYWNYKKNDVLSLDPFVIHKGNSGIKVWMFCQEYKYHEDYSVTCIDFTSNNSRCPYCCNYHGKVHPLDSLGQYIIDSYGKEFLDKIWSDKNKKSAFEYAPYSKERVLWRCFECKHEDYHRRISQSCIYEFRCPECTQERTESIIQEKTRLYLESLNNGNYIILHEGKCTLSPKNIINPPNNSSKKRNKGILKYDNEVLINDKHLFVEVMGQGHNQVNNLYHKKTAKKYNTTPQQELEYQIAKDRYKEQYVYDQGKNYHYLAIWYYHFDKEDTYKKLIDDKISEILNKHNTY